MKHKFSSLAVLPVLMLALFCSCASPAVKEDDTPTEPLPHVHSYTLTATVYDSKNTDYYEGEKPYLNGIEVALVCECGDTVTPEGKITSEDKPLARGDEYFTLVCGEYSLDFPVNVTPKYRIAFAGDSITEGGKIPYTVYIKKTLRHNVDIGNYGVSGISVTGMGGAWHGHEYAYEQQDVFDEVVGYAPELLFVMLGTNDAMGWADAEATFEEDFVSLITSFRRELPETKIVIMTPLPTDEGNAFSIPNDAIENGVLPTELAVAEKLGIDVFDTNSVIVSRGTDGLYEDGVHLSDGGKVAFAAIVTEKICEICGIER